VNISGGRKKEIFRGETTGKKNSREGRALAFFWVQESLERKRGKRGEKIKMSSARPIGKKEEGILQNLTTERESLREWVRQKKALKGRGVLQVVSGRQGMAAREAEKWFEKESTRKKRKGRLTGEGIWRGVGVVKAGSRSPMKKIRKTGQQGKKKKHNREKKNTTCGV